MISFLRNIPNLRCLDTRLTSNLIDGHEWERMIRFYLSKLKIFRLLMKDTLLSKQNIQKQLDPSVNPFRNSF